MYNEFEWVIPVKKKRKWMTVRFVSGYEIEIELNPGTSAWKMDHAYLVSLKQVANGFLIKDVKEEALLINKTQDWFEEAYAKAAYRETVSVSAFRSLKKLCLDLDETYKERYFDLLQEKMIQGYLKLLREGNKVVLLDPRGLRLLQYTELWFGSFEEQHIAHHRWLELMLESMEQRVHAVKKHQKFAKFDLGVMIDFREVQKREIYLNFEQKEKFNRIQEMVMDLNQYLTLPPGLSISNKTILSKIKTEKECQLLPKELISDLIQELNITLDQLKLIQTKYLNQLWAQADHTLCSFYDSIQELYSI